MLKYLEMNAIEINRYLWRSTLILYLRNNRIFLSTNSLRFFFKFRETFPQIKNDIILLTQMVVYTGNYAYYTRFCLMLFVHCSAQNIYLDIIISTQPQKWFDFKKFHHVCVKHKQNCMKYRSKYYLLITAFWMRKFKDDYIHSNDSI